MRACVLRNMSYVNIPRMVQILKAPLLRSLSDPNALVCKTGAMAVSKLAILDQSIGLTQAYIDGLYSLLRNNDPMVFFTQIFIRMRLLQMLLLLSMNSIYETRLSNYL